MIIKNFEFKKKIDRNINYFLLYGQNTGLINEVIEKDLKPIFSKNIYQYDEQQIITNNEQFKETIFNNSLFENDKLILISQATDKILSLIESLVEKKTNSIKIILKSNMLDNKSKLRKFFEKSDKTIIVPFYNDTEKTLSLIAFEYFKKRNFKISNQIINLIVQKANFNRMALNTELEKISSYGITNQIINYDNVKKIVNLSEDYDVSEIVNQCLLKNKKILINMLNEISLNNEKSIVFLRTFLLKLKKLKSLKISLEKEKNIERVLLTHRPPIFWKDKDAIKKQLNVWGSKEIQLLLKEVNKLELMIKKNPQITIHVINNFILEKLETINNKI